MKREDWHRIMSVNLTGAFDCAQAAIGDLLSGEDRRLIFIASVASLRGIPYAAHYGASKHGLLGLSRSLAREYATQSLTVNAICPGYVDTPMTDQSVARIQEKTGRSEEAGANQGPARGGEKGPCPPRAQGGTAPAGRRAAPRDRGATAFGGRCLRPAR